MVEVAAVRLVSAKGATRVALRTRLVLDRTHDPEEISIEELKNRVLAKQKTKPWRDRKPKVILKLMPPPKCAGIIARREISRGEVVAYYPLAAVTDQGRSDSLQAYFLELRDSNDRPDGHLVGRLDLTECQRLPIRKIAFLGPFANEPYAHERPNARYVYETRLRNLNRGDTVRVRIAATQTIRRGQEILVCYGDQYNRGEPPYQTGC